LAPPQQPQRAPEAFKGISTKRLLVLVLGPLVKGVISSLMGIPNGTWHQSTIGLVLYAVLQ
jgi:hypothetical protein